MNCFNKINKPLILLFLLYVLFHQSVIAQYNNFDESSKLDSLISYSQNYYGINDELVNGFVYALPDPGIQGHPYLNDKWEEGTFFIHGKTFQKILSKYDLVQDDIVIRVETNENTERIISVSKQQVDSLFLNKALFVNSRYFFQEKTAPVSLYTFHHQLHATYHVNAKDAIFDKVRHY